MGDGFQLLRPDQLNAILCLMDTPRNEQSKPKSWVIQMADIRKCPAFIMVPEHYREDGSCRCNDPDHTEMSEWGYIWNDLEGHWQ